MDSRKRSQIVVLTLVGLPLGAVALGNMIPAEQAMRRNLYTDRAACERDYSPEQCSPRTSSTTGSTTGSSTGAYRWYGPYYLANRTAALARGDPGAGRTGQISPTEASTRGGFGSFGRAMRSVASSGS